MAEPLRQSFVSYVNLADLLPTYLNGEMKLSYACSLILVMKCRRINALLILEDFLLTLY